MKKFLSVAISALFVSSAMACPEQGLRVEGTNCTIFASLVQCNQQVAYKIEDLEIKNTFVALKQGKQGQAITLTIKEIKTSPAAQGIAPLAVVLTYDNQIVYTVYRLPNGKIVRMDSTTDESGARARGLFAPEPELDPLTKLTIDFKAGGCR